MRMKKVNCVALDKLFEVRVKSVQINMIDWRSGEKFKIEIDIA